jgi:thiol-disulfide isomerase/thioredoxin
MREGMYRGVLMLDANASILLPFNFEIKYKNKKPLFIIRNADERIVADEISIKNDSVLIKMPAFDTEFKCKMIGNNLEGNWINNYRTSKNVIPFRATFGDNYRFEKTGNLADPVFEGKWEVTFSPGTKDSSKAIGIFKHVEQTDLLTGTFLTETGDYRYLEGIGTGKELRLSAFDGSHAFLFHAELKDGRLEGNFYSGSHWKETWIGVRNEKFSLKDAEEITFVKNPDLPISFTFNNLSGEPVSLGDKKFERKPVILQLMGSWCPNCLDESAYLAGLHDRYNPEGLEIVALAFEKTTDPVKARQQVMRLRDRLGIKYEILLPLKTGKEKAGEVLPSLNEVSAFPTTIFLNKQHQIVKVHTGFSGPATGQEYIIFKERTENLIKSLLKE